MLSALLEVALSIGLYYLLRAVGVGVFWALTAPALAVAGVAAATTVRRRRLDLLGLLVLCELIITVTLSLLTRSPLIAALREPAYFLVSGAFCLATLLGRAPLGHVTTATFASFGDPRRVAAFDTAWRDEPRYRRWQRLLTGLLGLLMVVSACIRGGILLAAPNDRLAHAVDVSNVLSFVTIGALIAIAAVCVQVPKKIIEQILSRTPAPATQA